MTHEHRPTKTPPYRIMGIDPGTNYMGYGVLEVDGRTLRSVVLGDIDLHKLTDPYAKLRYIFERVGALIDEYRPREVALESPFFGENVQSMLKLGRAQGVAMAAALSRNLPVTEYAPSRIKQSITGRGSAAKEQVAAIVSRSNGRCGVSMPPTAWPSPCVTTSPSATRSRPPWATTGSKGWAEARRLPRKTARRAGNSFCSGIPNGRSNKHGETDR
jgi:crossover junction endodeoxyribonuclease RuvC